MRKKILFTSNCFGEDRSAALIAGELKRLLAEKGLEMDVSGASLISEGKDYVSRGIDLLYSSYVPPSGGFPTRSFKGFITDLFHMPVLFKFIKTIKKVRDDIFLCIVVGDIPLLFLTRMALKNNVIVFLAPAKSDYIEPHYAIEEWYMKKNADFVLTHDEYTASNLRKKNINALFLGNPMMDGLGGIGEPVILNTYLKDRGLTGRNLPVIGILPGSREEAYDNFNLILGLIDLLAIKKKLVYLAAISGSLDTEVIKRKSAPLGWNAIKREGHTVLEKGGEKVLLCRNNFSEVLHLSDIVIGLAGTANEQAAGLGKPIVGFKGMGPQTTARRMEEQERLLGGALKFVKSYPHEAVNEILLLLDNPGERKSRGDAGIARMGGGGGARKISELIIREYFD